MTRRVRIGLYVAGGAALFGALLVLFLTQTDPGRRIVPVLGSASTQPTRIRPPSTPRLRMRMNPAASAVARL